jgi:PAS domain S-box-containing protein
MEEDAVMTTDNQFDTPTMLSDNDCRDNAWRSGAFITIDQNGVIVNMTPRAEAMFGYLRKELVGRAKIEVLVPELLQHKHATLRDAYFDVPSDRVMNKARPVFGRHKTGREISMIASLSSFWEQLQQFAQVNIVEINGK